MPATSRFGLRVPPAWPVLRPLRRRWFAGGVAGPGRLARAAALAPLVALGVLLAAGLPAGASAPAPAPALAPPQASPAPVATATGSIGIRLTDAPLSGANDPRARTYIVDHVTPGTTFQRHVQVSNSSGSAQHLLLYAGAAQITSKGWVADGSAGGNDLTSWITVSPSSVTLAAGSSATAVVTVAVPANASAGERYGVIWADLPPVAGAGPVAIANLVGVRVYLSVGAGGDPPSDFTIQSITVESGPELVVAVQNTGQRALDLTGGATLSGGPGSLTAGPFPANGFTLGIGDSTGIVIPLPAALPPGTWTASVTLASGTITHSVTAQVVIPQGPVVSPSAAPVRQRTSLPASGSGLLSGLPGLLAVVGGAIVLLGILLLFLAGRRRRRDREEPAAGPGRGSGQGPRHRF
jgi:hypothetical protein